MNRVAVAFVLALLAACHVRARAPLPLAPVGSEADLRVYLEPLPEDAKRLAFTVGAVTVVKPDGTSIPLQLLLPEVRGDADRSQRILASGRIAPGEYAGLAVELKRATLAGPHGTTSLLTPEEPVRVDAPFRIERGRALVATLSLAGEQAQANEFRFDGVFRASVRAPASQPVQSAGYCSTPALASLTTFDRQRREVTGVVPTGRQPLGIALDVPAQRAYVALGAEDVVQILDLNTGEGLRRIPLRAGDEPRELGLTPDGALLVVTCPGSNSVAFVDTVAAAVVATARVGDEPETLLLDRAGQRAYVLNRRSRSISVLDLASRAAVATVTTDPEPVAVQLNRDGTRLYVVARGSAFVTVLSVPDLAVLRTIFVGLGAGALKVDPRTDLVYVGRTDEGRIQVFDPVSPLPIDTIALPGPVSYLSLDAVENVLVAVLPTLGKLAFVDVTRRRVVAVVDAGGEPFRVALVDERF